jgi:multidrug efflux pump subunit AcrA (membrane-fusion protein)
MEAVLNVLETEAVGIVEKQSATVIIDAFPDKPLHGTITKISATASPIERNSPVKYFSVTVTLDKANPDWITPESQVTATIAINRIEDTIFVPNQAIFSDGSGDWVLLRKGSNLEKQEIELGLRGANRSQIISGLDEGAKIALFPPSESAPPG